MKRLIAVIFVLAGAASTSLADDCYRSRAVYQTYATPTYYAPTYYTPYQYTPAYNYAYPSYAATVYVPKVLEVEVQRDHYYSIDTYYQQSLLADAIVGRLVQRQQAIDAKSAEPPPQPVQPAIQPAPVIRQPLPQPAQVPGRVPLFLDRNRPSAYQNAELIAMVQAKCVKCHTAEQKMPLLTPDGKSLLDLTKCAALDTYFRCNTGDMPKTAPPVEDKFMPFLAEWARQSK